MTAPSGVRCLRAMWTTVEDAGLLPQLAENGSRWPKVCSDAPCDNAIACSRMYGIANFLQKVGRLCTEAADNEVFSPGFAVHGRAGEQGCCKVLIHAPDLVKRARRSARSEGRQRSWRLQADHRIALTSEPSTARHAGGPPDRWLGWSDSAFCLPSLQVRPRNADFAMALVDAPFGEWTVAM